MAEQKLFARHVYLLSWGTWCLRVGVIKGLYQNLTNEDKRRRTRGRHQQEGDTRTGKSA
jgi:hypothetical protein